MQFLAGEMNIERRIVDAWAKVMNYEERLRNNDSPRIFFFTMDITDLISIYPTIITIFSGGSKPTTNISGDGDHPSSFNRNRNRFISVFIKIKQIVRSKGEIGEGVLEENEEKKKMIESKEEKPLKETKSEGNNCSPCFADAEKYN
ncbi:hypothetical protein L6452_14624 [Arctium lappa]|uniref:Uncharacterized protein n=1 Tax=Arctium lappa TaxID=4217 RepID=A0ACB9CLK3_ARCLA|nr:hypothetical protein L6452_14624 [Arctium lappa]